MTSYALDFIADLSTLRKEGEGEMTWKTLFDWIKTECRNKIIQELYLYLGNINKACIFLSCAFRSGKKGEKGFLFFWV